MYRIFGPKGRLIVRSATAARVKVLLPALRRRFAPGTVRVVTITPARVTKREAALRKALAFKGTREIGTSNSGPLVDQFLKSAGLGPGYPWCMAFMHYCAGLVGLDLGGGAGVGAFLTWARSKGYEVKRPVRADYVCYAFSSSWPTDHVGQIVRVLRLGPVFVIRTIEGNTSPDAGGSQADGGSVEVKTRTVHASRVAFVRVLG